MTVVVCVSATVPETPLQTAGHTHTHTCVCVRARVFAVAIEEIKKMALLLSSLILQTIVGGETV